MDAGREPLGIGLAVVLAITGVVLMALLLAPSVASDHGTAILTPTGSKAPPVTTSR
jgi:hypothetical protein